LNQHKNYASHANPRELADDVPTYGVNANVPHAKSSANSVIRGALDAGLRVAVVDIDAHVGNGTQVRQKFGS